MKFRRRIQNALDELSLKIPTLAIHWFTTHKPIVSALQITFGKRMCLQVILNRNEFIIGGRRCSLSETEFVEIIIMQITQRLIDDLYQEALSWGKKIDKNQLAAKIAVVKISDLSIHKLLEKVTEEFL